MRPAEKLQVIAQCAQQTSKRRAYDEETYPSDIIGIIIFHKLHLSMSASSALRSHQQLRDQFVDWNEVRVSSVREIQGHLRGSDNSLDLAVFIKDFLEFVHRERHGLSLEFLAEENLSEVRRYLRQVKGIEHSTIDVVLRLRKDHPVLPLSPPMETLTSRLGVVRKSDTRDRRQKQLHELVEPGMVLAVHHFLLDHTREVCPPEEDEIDCPHCKIRKVCAYYARRGKTGKNAAKKSKTAKKTRTRTGRSGGSRKVMKKAVAAKRVTRSRK